jgi:hypothetical protein
MFQQVAEYMDRPQHAQARAALSLQPCRPHDIMDQDAQEQGTHGQVRLALVLLLAQVLGQAMTDLASHTV